MRRVVVYGYDIERVKRVAESIRNETTRCMTRDLRVYAYDIEDEVHEIILLDPHDELVRVYGAKGRRVTFKFDDDRPAVKEDDDEGVDESAGKPDDAYADLSTATLRDRIKTYTGRTPAESMGRERLVTLLAEYEAAEAKITKKDD